MSNAIENILPREADIAVRLAKPTQTAIVTKRVKSIEFGFFASPVSEAAKLATSYEAWRPMRTVPRSGFGQGDIGVVFQPLLEASTGEVSSVEALARWKSPSRGPVSPDVFIGVAEKAGLVDQLGFQVLITAIREAANCHGIGVAVNISPLQLKKPFFVRQATEALAEARFDPTRLTIEVTEGVLFSNPEQAKRAFNGLRELGVKIALDDFGCGFASIGTLREFGFDSMKIRSIPGLGRER